MTHETHIEPQLAQIQLRFAEHAPFVCIQCFKKVMLGVAANQILPPTGKPTLSPERRQTCVGYEGIERREN